MDDVSFCLGDFPGAGCRGDVDDLMDAGVGLFEFEGAIVKGGGESKAKFNEGVFAGAVSVVHGVELGKRLVGFVDEEEEVFGEVVEEAGGRISGGAFAEVAGVVFNAFAKADLFEHFEIVEGALLDALFFNEAIFCFKKGDPLVELLADGVDGCEADAFGCHVVGAGVDGDLFESGADSSCEGIDFTDAFDFIAEKFDSVGE